MITHSELLQTFDYDNGNLIWKKATGRKIKIGSIAGSPHSQGYRAVSVNKHPYLIHRLVWFYHYGRWPIKHLDHINGNKSDNRIENLRECNDAENHQNVRNRRKHLGKYTGVYENGSGFQARLTVKGVTHYLGTYDTPEIARDVYFAAKSKLHTFHPHPITR